MEKIYTVYAEKDDITFIMKDTEDTISVVGFYFGEPDTAATYRFMGSLTAHIEKE